jgi:hypothetical protein
MDINLLQKISLATAVVPAVAFNVFVAYCRMYPKSCEEGSGDGILIAGPVFMLGICLLLLASTYELLFSNATQGANGIRLSIVTVVSVFLGLALAGTPGK